MSSFVAKTAILATSETFQGFENLVFTLAGGLPRTPGGINLQPAGHYRLVFAG